jgi:hypothetical protein
MLYKSTQAPKSARYVKFGVIATTAMKNAVFLSLKLYSLVKIIRSHRSIAPPFSEQMRFFCIGWLYVERKKTIDDSWLFHEAVPILEIFSVKTYKNMIAFAGLERTQKGVCIGALSLY